MKNKVANFEEQTADKRRYFIVLETQISFVIFP